MPTYVRQVRIEETFDGQPVVAVLRPLAWSDVLRLRSGNDAEAVADYAKVLPQYLVSCSVIADADGAAVPIEEVLTSAFYAPLVGRWLGRHVEAASPPDP